MASPIVCLDMAGTVVNDGGSVEDAFTQALSAVAEPTTDEIANYIQATMGQSKIEVFTALLGDEQQAKLQPKRSTRPTSQELRQDPPA